MVKDVVRTRGVVVSNSACHPEDRGSTPGGSSHATKARAARESVEAIVAQSKADAAKDLAERRMAEANLLQTTAWLHL